MLSNIDHFHRPDFMEMIIFMNLSLLTEIVTFKKCHIERNK